VSDLLPASDPAFVNAVKDLLVEGGPLTEEDLVTTLAESSPDLDEDEVADALDDVLDVELELAMPLPDGRWTWLPALLAGRLFTHRLSAGEVEHDLLDVNPDLEPVAMLLESDDYGRLTDGSTITSVLAPYDSVLFEERGIPLSAGSEFGSLLLPAGRLGRCSAGDLIGLRLAPQGLILEVIDKQAVSPEASAELAQHIETLVGAADDEPELLTYVIWQVCADHQDAFRQPVWPLGQLLDEQGLARDGDWLAAAGFDFPNWRVGGRIAGIAEQYRISDDEALAVLAMSTLYEQVASLCVAVATAEGGTGASELVDSLAELTGVPQTTPERAEDPERVRDERETVRASLGFLAEPAVAEAVLAETLDSADPGGAALGLFAETLEPLAPRSARAPLRWLRAHAYQRLGDAVRAEETFRAAEALDPTWPPTLFALARYASDRGDASRGLGLLRRVGAPPDHELVELLEHFKSVPRADLGRNDRCWCGSGRKYKQCHMHREAQPLAERAAWLYQKAGMFLVDGPYRDTMIETALVRSRFADAPDSSEALPGALDDPLIADLVLFEGGVFADFVANRGVLLPDDELQLAEGWLLIERSIFDVVAVRRGTGLTVRDVRTGDIHDVREHTASQQLTAGELICARVVPAGETMQIFGGIEPVALHQRDELIDLLDSEPEPLELVDFLTRRFAPPALQNTEGEPLVLCEATLHVLDPAPLKTALNKTYQLADPDVDADSDVAASDGSAEAGHRWFEFVATHGMQRIRATLCLDGADLHVSANSEQRFDRVLDTVRGLQPSLQLISQSRQPTRDVREAGRLAPGSGSSAGDGAGQLLDPRNPDVAAVLDQVVREYENAWFDEPIPALAGRTPREAASDPTRRPDLIRLLDSFPASSDKPGSMSRDRLRAALGLR